VTDPFDGHNRPTVNTLCIGVAGGTGSGKTTVANEIVRRVGRERIVTINQDRYYHDLAHLIEAQRIHHNFDHPDAIEESLLVETLKLLKVGKPAELPVYDFSSHVRTAQIERAEARPVILLEGILILAIPDIRELLDIKIFVDTDADLRFIRRLNRDIAERGRSVENVVEQWLATVRPMHLEFVEQSKRWADVIIPEGGFNTVALDLVISRILQMLQTAS
jgi:uridine kinase